MSVMLRLIRAHCVQTGVRRNNKEKFLQSQTHQGESGSGSGTKKITFLETRTPQNRTGSGLVLAVAQAWRLGRKLLVLRLGGQGLVDPGVVDDLAKQPLAQRRQRA